MRHGLVQPRAAAGHEEAPVSELVDQDSLHSGDQGIPVPKTRQPLQSAAGAAVCGLPGYPPRRPVLLLGGWRFGRLVALVRGVRRVARPVNQVIVAFGAGILVLEVRLVG